jgi:hypothetical protein
MTILIAKNTLESRLAANFPTTPIAYEGVSFSPPSGNYLRCQIKILEPDDRVRGAAYYRENLVFQVFVVTTVNQGSASAITLAQQIRSVFPKGWATNITNGRIHVLNTPQIGSVMTPDNRLVVPVFIPVTMEVFS